MNKIKKLYEAIDKELYKNKYTLVEKQCLMDMFNTVSKGKKFYTFFDGVADYAKKHNLHVEMDEDKINYIIYM